MLSPENDFTALGTSLMPTLTWTFSGHAYRARKNKDGNWEGVRVESIFGSFRLLRKEEGRLILGDGGGETEYVWIVHIPREVAA
jgi:hypothetical protein